MNVYKTPFSHKLFYEKHLYFITPYSNQYLDHIAIQDHQRVDNQ